MPGSWSHLAVRFFGTLGARSLAEAEAAFVDALLTPDERVVFREQSTTDRRHGHDSADAVARRCPERRDLQRAALLHDVAKRRARLGIGGRVLASVAIKLGLPLRGRFRTYADHGALAAVELKTLGAEPLVVEFARHHHGSRPPTITAADWEVLKAADV